MIGSRGYFQTRPDGDSQPALCSSCENNTDKHPVAAIRIPAVSFMLILCLCRKQSVAAMRLSE